MEDGPPVKWTVASKLWLSSQPLMEVAAPTASSQDGHVLRVHESWKEDSTVVADLQPCTQLKVLLVKELEDGTRRGYIILNALGEKPLGWATITTAGGTPTINVVFGPVYEIMHADTSRKGCLIGVTKAFNESSTRVSQLKEGTRVYLLEQRRNMHGAQRARIKVVGQKVSLGWVTARTPDGTQLLREMKDEASRTTTVRTARQSEPRTPTRRTPSRETSARGMTARGTSRGVHATGNVSWPSPSPAWNSPGGSPFASPRVTSSMVSSPRMGRTGHYFSGDFRSKGLHVDSTPPTVSSAPSLSSAVRATVDRLTSKSHSALRLQDGKESEGDGHEKGVPGWNLGPSSAPHAVDKATTACMIKHRKLLTSSALEMDAAEFDHKAALAEGLSEKVLSVLVGEVLQAKKIKVDELVREWDPKDRGLVTKQDVSANRDSFCAFLAT